MNPLIFLKLIPWQAWAALTAVLVVGAAYCAGTIEGRSQARVEGLKASVEALRERNETDAEIQGLDDYSLCIALNGLHDECSKL